jgi:hypothetical protein
MNNLFFILLALQSILSFSSCIPSAEKIKAFEEWYSQRNPSFANSKVSVIKNAEEWDENRLGILAKEALKVRIF